MLFRILGKAFNPLKAFKEDENSSLAILHKLPDSVKYEYSLGMNTIRHEFYIRGKDVQSE